MRALLLLFVCCISCSSASPVENLEVKVSENSKGAFQIYVSGKLWFNSADVWIHNNEKWFSTQDESLTLTGTSSYMGIMDWGYEDGVNFHWIDCEGRRYTTYVLVFREIPVAIFGQKWDDGGVNVSVGTFDETLSMWPTLKIEDHTDVELGYTTWAGTMFNAQPTGVLNSSTEDIYNKVDGGFPLAIFDSKMENTLVISPQNTFMSAHQMFWKPDGYDVPVWGTGFLGTVDSIPAGYSIETLMVAGQTVSGTMEKWGTLLRMRYGKTDAYRLVDITVNYLGYYTDNGACYYYYTGDYANYEEALLDVKKTAELNNIPYQYVNLDSWWYYKGIGDGVKNWTAMPDVFPNGIREVSALTDWPVVAHNRWFSPDTDYAKQNGGDFNFVIDNDHGLALPDDPTFWRYLFKTARDEWNLRVYEQDWLQRAFERMTALQNDMGYGKRWLDEMGKAAMDLGITIQYCSALTRYVLQSVMIPAVTQMRVSPDYQPGNSNWHIGDSTMLAHAVGIAAFKDTFHTVVNEEKCKFTHPEPYPALETYMATLSGGPVGPSDQAGTLNKTLIMATCMADGKLLKPTKPTMSLDGSFLLRAFGTGGPDGQVYSSYSEVSGFVWYQIISADNTADYSLTLSELPSCPIFNPCTSFPESVALQYNLDGTIRGEPIHIKQNTDSIPLKECGRDDFEYWLIAPVIPETGGALLGELNKIVSISEQRILTIFNNNDVYYANLRGASEEVVYMSSFDLQSGKITTVKCVLASDGTGTLYFTDIASMHC